MFDNFFKFKEKGTTFKTEILAGVTTYFTMVYIVFVNPSILGVSGIDTQVAFVTTSLIAAIGSIAMGFFTNLPIALAPAMGLNAFFSFVVVSKLGYSWQVGMGAIFLGSFSLFLLTLFKVRYWLISSIPSSLRVGIGAGIGLFIALLGFENMHIIVGNPTTLVTVGDLTNIDVLLGVLGVFIILVLAARGKHWGVLASIMIVTILALILDDNVTFNGVISTPPALTSVVGQVDIVGAFDLGLLGIIFSFMLVNLFDSSGTLIAVTQKIGVSDEKGCFPKMKSSLFVDSLASVGGAFMGTSSVGAFIESGSGVSVGGRTGLTAIVVGILFLLTIFLSPIASIVPPYATAGSLIFVGVLMTSSLVEVKWNDLTEAVPAFITTVMMPFTFSITEGIAFGFISFCIMKAFTGKLKEINLPVVLISILFIIKFALV